MSIEIQTVQRVRVATEAAGSFAADKTGTLGDFIDVPFVEGSLTMALTQPMLDVQYAQQSKDGMATKRLGVKSWTMGMTLNLAPTGTAAGDGDSAVQGAVGRILAAVMGLEQLGTGTLINDVSPTATVFAVDSSTGLTEGRALGWVNGSGQLEARPIQTETSDITLRYGLSAAPADDDEIFASASYFLAEDPDTSLQFIVEGAEQDDRWLLMGGQLDSMTIDLPMGELARITFNFKGVEWFRADGVNTVATLTGTAIGTASYANAQPVAVEGHVFVRPHDDNTYAACTPVSSITIAPALAYVPQSSVCGVNTVARWVRDRAVPVVSGSFVVPFEDATWFTERDTLDLQQILVQLGATAGGTVLLDLPQVQITDVQREGSDSIASQTVSFEAQRDGVTSGDGARQDSAFRIHLL